ncbi:MAG: hypothetical protein KOO62_04135 [candidate division Zixibacteria bacterium]|nr:hypothetical protein [candidate division Zixibacteria bacterium]
MATHAVLQKVLITLLTVLVAILTTPVVNAEVPRTINYQGLLTDQDTGEPITGTVGIMFRFYRLETDNVGDSLWGELHLNVSVTEGLFHVILGSTYQIPNSVFSEPECFLGIQVGSDPEILPRIEMTSVVYAFMSTRSDTATYALAAPATSDGDWTVSGGNVFRESGNVGIGTSDPSDDLHIEGDQVRIRFNGDSENNLLIVAPYSLSHGGRIQCANDGGGSLKGLELRADPVVLMGGPVGIGTSEPGGWARLHVQELSSSNCAFFEGVMRGVMARAYGPASGSFGVQASSTNPGNIDNYGVSGRADSSTNNYGVYGSCSNSSADYGVYSYGNFHATGSSTKGGGGFKIDHPQNPENNFLSHSDVSSPDMKNVYDGMVTIDDNGEAVVELPPYFESLNESFRYQLTCIGDYSPVYIAEKISGNRFTIAGGKPSMEVSWQVTGIRKDAFAKTVSVGVAEMKESDKQGLYMHPEAFGFGMEKSLNKKNHELMEDFENH